MIGQYIDQLDEIGALLDAPVIKGETPVKERQRLFEAFRSGEIDLLVVSKVANFSIDLPEAAVAIQVSGSFGSRQEEAQRLGRLLRPKTEGRSARFYADRLARHRRRRLRPEPAALPRRSRGLMPTALIEEGEADDLWPTHTVSPLDPEASIHDRRRGRADLTLSHPLVARRSRGVNRSTTDDDVASR